jgi:hypothetical protein
MSTAPIQAGDPLKVITCKCIISYPHVFKPRIVKAGDKPRYGCALIFDINTDRPCLEQLQRAAYEAGRSMFRDFDDGAKAKRYALPWRRGEERDGKGYGTGKVFLNVNADNPPGVVDRYVQPILDPREIYAGAWVIASLRAFPYNFENMKKGVSFGLNNLQKVADGERLDNRSTPSQDFTPLGDDPMMGTGASIDDMFR